MNYKSPNWKKLRSLILRRDMYTCQHFCRYGKMKEANTVHHIFPADEFPEYQYKAWNLVSLSNEAHNMMHDRTTNELTEAGIDLLRRTARKNNIAVPLRYQ